MQNNGNGQDDAQDAAQDDVQDVYQGIELAYVPPPPLEPRSDQSTVILSDALGPSSSETSTSSQSSLGSNIPRASLLTFVHELRQALNNQHDEILGALMTTVDALNQNHNRIQTLLENFLNMYTKKMKNRSTLRQNMKKLSLGKK